MIRKCSHVLLVLLGFLLAACSPKSQPSLSSTSRVAQKIIDDKINFLQESAVQLSIPQVYIDSLIFAKAATINMDLDLAGSEIFYTINEGTPQRYIKPFQITESSSLMVSAEKSGYVRSEPVAFKLIKTAINHEQTSISVSPDPNGKYPGGGPESFVDLQKGTLNFKEGNTWSGFQNEEIEIMLDFNEPQSINKIYLSLLKDHNSWIFLPQEIEVWSEEKLIYAKTLPLPKEAEDVEMKFIDLKFSDDIYTSLKLKIKNSEIPSWHVGAGTIPWLFMDEIIIE